MNKMKYENEKIFWLVIVGIFSLASSAQFIVGNFPYGHDIRFHLCRIEGIADGLIGGQFPVKIYGDFFNGYGYPAGFFYPDLFLYVPAVFRIFGADLLDCYKIFILFMNFVTGFVGLWIFSRFFQSYRAGGITALIYIGYLYRLVDLQTRAAVGEFSALAFMPLALISLWLMLNESPKYWISVVLGFTGVLQSHILSSLLLIIAASVLTLVSFRKLFEREKFFAFVKSAVFTALLNIWFYGPFISFYNQYDFFMKHVSSYFNEFLNKWLWSPKVFWELEGFSGIFFMLMLAILTVFVLCRKFMKKTDGEFDKTFFTMLLTGIFFTLTALEIFPWRLVENFPVLEDFFAKFQFAYRFLVYTTLAWTISFGIAATEFFERLNFGRSTIVAFCIIIFTTNFNVAEDLDSSFTVSFRQTYANSTTEVYARNAAINIDNLPEKYKNIPIIDFVGIEKDSDKIIQEGYLSYDYTYSDFGEMVLKFMNENHSTQNSEWFYIELSNAVKKICPFGIIGTEEFISNFEKKGMTVKFTSNAPEPTKIRLPLFYYPVYAAKTSAGENLNLSSGEFHVMYADVPAGKNDVTIKYIGQKSWQNAEFISLAALILFLFKVKTEF